MLYLVTGEWIDDPTAGEEFPTLWEHMVRPFGCTYYYALQLKMPMISYPIHKAK